MCARREVILLSEHLLHGPYRAFDTLFPYYILLINLVVLFPDPTTHEQGKGLGILVPILGSASSPIICIGFLLAHVQSHDGAQDQENAPMSPDPFPRERLGSGNETINLVVVHVNPLSTIFLYTRCTIHGVFST